MPHSDGSERPSRDPRQPSGTPIPGRRTVTIRGQVADRGRVPQPGRVSGPARGAERGSGDLEPRASGRPVGPVRVADSGRAAGPARGDTGRPAAEARVPARHAPLGNGRPAAPARGAGRRNPRIVEVNRRRPARRVRDHAISRPDRVAMWAVFLCLLLVVAAAASARAAVHTRAGAHRPAAAIVRVHVSAARR